MPNMHLKVTFIDVYYELHAETDNGILRENIHRSYTVLKLNR